MILPLLIFGLLASGNRDETPTSTAVPPLPPTPPTPPTPALPAGPNALEQLIARLNANATQQVAQSGALIQQGTNTLTGATPTTASGTMPGASTPATTASGTMPSSATTATTPATPATPATTATPAATDLQTSARTLLNYVLGGGRDPATIRGLQQRLGVSVDGVVGPETRGAVARALVTSGNASGTMLQRQNALALSMYRAQGGNDRTTIREHQAGMGGVDVDGVFGTQTQNRMNALIGA